MVLVQEGERIEPEQVFSGRGSLAGMLDKLAAEPGQWFKFIVTNSSIATQIKKHKGYDTRIRCIQKELRDDAGRIIASPQFELQACYVGPDFIAEIQPRIRKPRRTVQIRDNVPLPSTIKPILPPK